MTNGREENKPGADARDQDEVFRFSSSRGLYLPDRYVMSEQVTPRNPVTTGPGILEKILKWISISAPVLSLVILFLQTRIMEQQAQIMNKTLPPMIDQAIAAKKQAEIAEKSSSETIKTFRLDRRPYIWLTSKLDAPGLHVGKLQDANASFNQVVWNWTMVNYGKSPAHNIRFEHHIKVGDRPFTQFGFKGMSGGSPMPPNADWFSTTVSAPGISREEWNELLKTDRSITLRGRVLYTDDSQESFESGFCLARLASGAIQYCREGNYIK